MTVAAAITPTRWRLGWWLVAAAAGWVVGYWVNGWLWTWLLVDLIGMSELDRLTQTIQFFLGRR